MFSSFTSGLFPIISKCLCGERCQLSHHVVISHRGDVDAVVFRDAWHGIVLCLLDGHPPPYGGREQFCHPSRWSLADDGNGSFRVPPTPGNGVCCHWYSGSSSVMMRAGLSQSDSCMQRSLIQSNGSGMTAIPVPGVPPGHARVVRMGVPGASKRLSSCCTTFLVAISTFDLMMSSSMMLPAPQASMSGVSSWLKSSDTLVSRMIFPRGYIMVNGC